MRMRLMSGAISIWLLLIFAAPLAARDTGFLNRSVTIGGTMYRYQVYVPAEWTKKQHWPVVLSLHGAGERGTDGLFSTENGIGRAIRRNVKAFPFVVVFPQCPNGVYWTDKAMQEMAMAALESAIKEFKGDRQRLYLTGLSMGGYGTWEMAMRYPGHFAAIAPVCGALHGSKMLPDLRSQQVDLAAENPFSEAAKKIGKVPVWIFHGAKDPVIPVEESRRMAEALKAEGAGVRYTEYLEATHNSWDRAYAEPEFSTWLLAQRRK
ncbi:MAG TPA: prolyl oligopeptidase family serine peptidase [Terriglobales bacterium]|nr:prolyl oligopeptidase family serine peptidase [Terriglobales bacterium]